MSTCPIHLSYIPAPIYIPTHAHLSDHILSPIPSVSSFEASKQGKTLEEVQFGRESLIFVGKHSSCQLQLEHPSLSRRHAVLLQDRERGILLVDLGSKSGVTLNGRRLPPSLGIPIKDGGAVVFGGSSRTYTLRVREVDKLQALQAQQAAIASQIQQLEADAKDESSLFGLIPTSKRPDPTKTTCFFGNLSYEVTEEALRELIEEHSLGAVLSVRLPTDQTTGQPRGIGFVEFGTAEEASECFKALHDEEFLGRTLKVDLSETKRPSRPTAAPANVQAPTRPVDGRGEGAQDRDRGRDRDQERGSERGRARGRDRDRDQNQERDADRRRGTEKRRTRDDRSPEDGSGNRR